MIEEQVNGFLLNRDFRQLVFLEQQNKCVWKLLRSNLYQTDETLRWHSIEAVAQLMRHWWDHGRQEKVRDYLRRLIWSISDESGGIGWSAPQTIAEIAVAIPQLYDPYVDNMIDRALGEPVLLKCGLWGIGRLGVAAKRSVVLFQDMVLASFTADDPETLGLAAWAVGETGCRPAFRFLQQLLTRPEPVRIYIQPEFQEKTLGIWAEDAIKKIEQF